MTSAQPRLILGSASPRRLELLAQIGVVPDEVRPADIDETPQGNELPRAYCQRVTASKARAVAREPGALVLVGDTTVALGRRIFGKPRDAAEAVEFLEKLSGRRHKVITSVAVMCDTGLLQRDVVSTVRMKRLSQQELQDYLASEDWMGKAGGYAIQGPAGRFIPWLSGSYTGIVGLPVSETAALLTSAGYQVGRG